MTDPTSLAPNFLRDAFGDYAQYSSANKQDMQKRALKMAATPHQYRS